MSETDATVPARGSVRRRLVDRAATYPEVVGIAVYAVVAMVFAVAAYYAIFTLFQPYDDEGTLLITVKAFVNGETLYRHIYSSYGPFYYEVFGGFFGFTGQDVTTDAGRTIVIVLWVSTSLLFGLVSHRLTKSLLLGVSGAAVAFIALGVLISEPMHPQGLCVLLLGAFALIAVLRWDSRTFALGAGAGAVLAALLLTKVNLGLFAIAAVVLAATLTFEPLRSRAWIRWPVIAAFLLMPIVVLGRDLDQDWVRALATVEILSMVALLVAAWPQRFARDAEEARFGRWLMAAVAGFAVAAVVIIGIVLLTGPSVADVYDGVVGKALRVRDVLVLQIALPAGAIVWAVAAVAAAGLANALRSGPAERPTIWPGLLRTAAGLGIWLTAARIAPLGLDVARNPETLPLVLCWVAAIKPAGVEESAQWRFLRVLLPALAVAEALQVYPVAGSQLGIAAVTFVPVGALCLADALHNFKAWSAERGGDMPRRLGLVTLAVSATLAAALTLNYVIRPAATNVAKYRNEPALQLPGAELVHLPQTQVEEYEGLVDQIKANRCTALIGYPNFGSLSLWSGAESPPPQVPDAWMKAFDAGEQQEVVDEMKATPRPCAVKNESLAATWLAGAPAPPRPLVRYIFDDFVSVATIGGFEFLLPRGTEPSEVGG